MDHAGGRGPAGHDRSAGSQRERGRRRLPEAGAARTRGRSHGRARCLPRSGGCPPGLVERDRQLDGIDAGCGPRRRPGAGRGEGASAGDVRERSRPRRLAGGWHAGRVAAEPAVYRRMARGNQSIADAAARLLPDVRLGRRATSVIERRGRVEIGAGDDRIDADAVVVAVPVRLVTELAFDPPLLRAAGGVRGAADGGGVEARPPARRRTRRCAIQCADLPFWFWVADGDDGRPRRVVTSFAGSELPQEALATASGDPRVWVRRIVELAPELRPAGSAVMKVWGHDALSRGAYSAWDHPSVARRPQFERMHGAIAFAGSTRPATIPERWRARFGAASERCRRCSSCSATRERADAQA